MAENKLYTEIVVGSNFLHEEMFVKGMRLYDNITIQNTVTFSDTLWIFKQIYFLLILWD